MYKYDIICKERIEDLHETITKRFNPILAEIYRKYCQPKGYQRPLIAYYNEEDGARVQVVYTNINSTLEEAVVNALYNLRDLFVRGKIDLNMFRHEVGQLAIMVHSSVLEMYPYLEKMLSALGCSLIIKPSLTKYPTKGHKYNDPTEYIKLLSSFDLKDVATLKIVLKNKEKNKERPLPNQKFGIRVKTVVESTIKTLEFNIETNKKGEVVIPVRKFSIIRIILPYSIRRAEAIMVPRGEKVSVKIIDNKQVELVVGKQNIELKIDIKKREYWIYLLAGICGMATALMLYELFISH